MHTYSQVESVLARVHGVQPEGIGAFRGRIKNFQKLGIVPESPGRGRRIEYSLEHVFVWGFCLELAEFGIDPSVISSIWRMTWPQVRPVLLDPIPAPKDKHWCFTPTLLGRDPRALDASLTGVPFWISAQIVTGSPEFSEVGAGEDERSAGFIARYGMINLSRLRRSILFALEMVG